MGAEDQAVLVTHQPGWLQDWFHEEAAAGLNLRQLVRGHLCGRARLHLAGESLLSHPLLPPQSRHGEHAPLHSESTPCWG